MTHWRAVVGFGTMALVIAAMLACGSEVPGERAQNGSCPEGERCSDETPEGLTFIGTGFWDDATVRLGPILAGGRFDIGLMQADGSAVPPFAVEVEDPSVLAAGPGAGRFDPGAATGVEVSAYLTVTALSEGVTRVRIVDPSTGALFDRITLPVYYISDATLVNVADPDRTYLQRDTEEVLGVRLLIGDTSATTRAIDQDVQLTADGDVQPELMYWDCFSYQVPDGVDEVTFTIVTGGETYTRTLSVQ